MNALRLSTVSFILLVLAAACHPGSDAIDPEAAAGLRAEALAKRDVSLVSPEIREEHPNLQLVGEVRSFDTVSISTEVAGKVDKVHVEVGDRVERGQALVEVDRATFKIYLDQAAAQLAAARANLALTAKDLERKQDLLSDETIPQAVFDQAKAAHDLASAEVSAAEAARDLAQRNLDRSVVRAPAAGSINKRMVVAGQWAEVGVPLFTLAIGDTFKVAALVPSDWAVKLAGLEGFEFTVGLDTVVHRAKLYSVDPAVEKMSRSFEVVGIAENRSGQLKPGLFANINLTAPNAERTLWLPASAIETAGLPKVLFATDGVVTERDVQTGRRVDGNVEVLEGLAEGEVVISKVAGLARGMPIRVVGDAHDS
jgi:membrane fusion protein (multidrug efflux system)